VAAKKSPRNRGGDGFLDPLNIFDSLDARIGIGSP
jgi:hypothetical protein